MSPPFFREDRACPEILYQSLQLAVCICQGEVGTWLVVFFNQ